MSHFYGSIPNSGRKTIPTARGHKSTGLIVYASSDNGAIETRLWYDKETGFDMFKVLQQTPDQQGSGVYEVLASGVVGEKEEED